MGLTIIALMFLLHFMVKTTLSLMSRRNRPKSLPTRSLETEVAVASSSAKDTALEREPRLPKSEMGQRLLCKGRSVSLQEGDQCLSTSRHCLPLGSGKVEPEWAEEWPDSSGTVGTASVVGREARSCVGQLGLQCRHCSLPVLHLLL